MADVLGSHLGAWVASQRERVGLSQQRLAEQLGLDQAAVSRIEGGHRRLMVEELVKVAEVLDIAPDEIGRLFADLISRSQSWRSVWERET